MFSTNDRHPVSAQEPVPPSHTSVGSSTRWSHSILVQLTGIYAFSSFVLLAVATGILYLTLTESVSTTHDDILRDELDMLMAATQEQNGIDALKDEVQESNARHLSRYEIRLLIDGRVIIESPGMTQNLPTELFQGMDGHKGHGTTVLGAQGHQWRIMRADVYPSLSNSSRSVLEIGIDTSRESEMLQRYQLYTLAILIGGLFTATAAGAMTAYRGLKPLSEIVKLAQRITATRLNARIGASRWPRELEALAVAFDAMLIRLEDSFQRLSRFSADLAHELRTPINNLMGEAEVTLSRSRNNHEYRQVLESAMEEYSRLARMIDSLLFLARAEAADRHIQRVLLRAEKEIEVVLTFLETSADEKGVAMSLSGNGQVYADSGLLRRAVSNLVWNAIHYTPRGGHVSVTLRPTRGGALDIEVMDSGVGIVRSDMPHLFDRFFRADQARSQYSEGSGLGLAIVKSIMELHDGHVLVESEPGQGSTFTLHFPAPASTDVESPTAEPWQRDYGIF